MKASLFHTNELPRAANRFAADQQGQDVAEYSLLLVCLFLAALLVWAVLNGPLYELLTKALTCLDVIRVG